MPVFMRIVSTLIYVVMIVYVFSAVTLGIMKAKDGSGTKSRPSADRPEAGRHDGYHTDMINGRPVSHGKKSYDPEITAGNTIRGWFQKDR